MSEQIYILIIIIHWFIPFQLALSRAHSALYCNQLFSTSFPILITKIRMFIDNSNALIATFMFE